MTDACTGEEAVGDAGCGTEGADPVTGAGRLLSRSIEALSRRRSLLVRVMSSRNRISALRSIRRW